jgi:cell division septum initiation protein DivIVA
VGIETSDADPVPLGHRFDVVWRGYHRRQVNEYVDLALGWLAADRDTAVNLVSELALQLDECRSETLRLRQRVDQLCREPMNPDGVADRLRRHVEIACGEASDIVASARARADHIRIAALDKARRREVVADRKRQQVEEDFRVAMAARRDEAMRNLRTYEQACRDEADRLVRDAREDAARLARHSGINCCRCLPASSADIGLIVAGCRHGTPEFPLVRATETDVNSRVARLSRRRGRGRCRG